MHMSVHCERFALAKRASAYFFSRFFARNVKTDVRPQCPFWAFAFRLSETHIRWLKKKGTILSTLHSGRFALAKRTKLKCGFHFERFASVKCTKNREPILSTLTLCVSP